MERLAADFSTPRKNFAGGGTLESAKSYWEKKGTPCWQKSSRYGKQKLRQISADYTRVKRVLGSEQVAAAVEADRQRE